MCGYSGSNTCGSSGSNACDSSGNNTCDSDLELRICFQWYNVGLEETHFTSKTNVILFFLPVKKNCYILILQVSYLLQPFFFFVTIHFSEKEYVKYLKINKNY